MNLGVHTQNKSIIHLFLRMLCLVLMLHFCAEHCEHAPMCFYAPKGWHIVIASSVRPSVPFLSGA